MQANPAEASAGVVGAIALAVFKRQPRGELRDLVH